MAVLLTFAIPHYDDAVEFFFPPPKPVSTQMTEACQPKKLPNRCSQDFPAIEMMQKANKLVKDTSGELQDLKYICDLRPVYNDERTDVDAFVLVANLRMIYLEQNNERSVCEIALTEEELLMVKEETEKALAKMKVLKQVGASLDSKSAGDVK